MKLSKSDKELIKKGGIALGLNHSDEGVHKQALYLELLLEANKNISLTGIKNPKEAVIKHTIDSLSVSGAIEGKKIVDIGSGGGTPGIPLAIANPEKKFYLIDSVLKKIKFLDEAIRTLELDNVETICDRGENIGKLSANTVVSRAFGSLNYLIESSKKMVSRNGLFLAMKGKINQEEINELKTGFSVLQIQEIEVPYLEATRHFVFIKRT
ncbi:MAG: 16S rRNA (guanine(527)-N(7))-methyltransferase RsmG [Gammaproteobacteria bacterium]|nr:16S rRNA (guanine(527)-N(7))-methyltransferase RsmG [Gammaproteobacteria bacterium]OUT94060.1 MAG: 16S rRNA (guanine(527)-N(7))-methyltransferase RsmG [Gammaproteobacteria bacterium TMED36]